MARQNLLIVDGDARNRRVLEVSLRKAGFSITAAPSAEQALEYLEHSEPDLIISDTRLPGDDGFELCVLVKSDARWKNIPFIFLTSEKSVEDKVRGLELGVEDYLTKPIYIKEITTRVSMLLQRKQHERLERKDTRTKFTGRLADMAVVDLLQTIEISRKSGVMHFTTELGEAQVWFREGAVIDAAMGRLQGEAAIYRLLGLNDGDFELEFKTISRSKVIDANTQALLMEGMRRVDEWGRLMEQLPPLDSVLAVEPAQFEERKSDLAPEQIALLRRIDGRRNIIEIVDDSGQDDLDALNLISTFYFEGLLTPSTVGLDEESPDDPVSLRLEDWDAPPKFSYGVDAASSHAHEPSGASEPVERSVPEAEVPPPPSYPAPFPQFQPDDGMLMPGIPEDASPRPAFGDALVSLEPGATSEEPPVLSALSRQLTALEQGRVDVFEEGPPPGLGDGDEQEYTFDDEELSDETLGFTTPAVETRRSSPTRSPAATVSVGGSQSDIRMSDANLEPANLGRVNLKRVVRQRAAVEIAANGISQDEPRMAASGLDFQPMTVHVAPPLGVPRATASGAFDTKGIPEPDPLRMPRSIDDGAAAVRLEHHLDAALPVADVAPADEPQTLEFEQRDELSLRRGKATPPFRETLDDFSEASDEHPAMAPRDEHESIGVRILGPAREAESWRGSKSNPSMSGLASTASGSGSAAAISAAGLSNAALSRTHGSAVDSHDGYAPPVPWGRPVRAPKPRRNFMAAAALVVVSSAAGGFAWELTGRPAPQPVVVVSQPADAPQPAPAPAEASTPTRLALELERDEPQADAPARAEQEQDDDPEGDRLTRLERALRELEDEEPPAKPPEEEPPQPVVEAAPPPVAAPVLDPAVEAKVEEAEKLHKFGKVAEARAAVDAILAEFPTQARALVLRANLLLERGKLEEALAAAQASVAADPKLTQGYLVLGVILQERRDLAGAAQAYRTYLDLAPEGLYAPSIRRQLKTLESKLASRPSGADLERRR